MSVLFGLGHREQLLERLHFALRVECGLVNKHSIHVGLVDVASVRRGFGLLEQAVYAVGHGGISL